jgi:hypothetical protein
MAGSDLVEEILVAGPGDAPLGTIHGRFLRTGPVTAGEALRAVLEGIRTEQILLLPQGAAIVVEPGVLEAMLHAAGATGAGLVYSDYYDGTPQRKVLHPLNDYRQGSVRDDFDFGAMVMFQASAVREALSRYGICRDTRYGALYDLRLKVSIDHAVHHVAEPLYTVLQTPAPGEREGEGLFAYVDPRNAGVQKEMEGIFTDYLKHIGAYLPAGLLREAERAEGPFPVEASVIIPVKNRAGTVTDAVESALSQETDFSFNIIVVDNHSTDGTTALLSSLAARHGKVCHIVPARMDLAIGGCWNEALSSKACGRYAVQLDSDDLYGGPTTLQSIVDMLRQGPYAMVIGSYTLVDSTLREIPPGLVAHKEWTDENGHNNALRVNGLGAPRAFDRAVMSRIGFLNVSYGEDYAAALRICRQYRIGRIYESLYLCRRWTGNTDAALTVEAANRNNDFKDSVRSAEIEARQRLSSEAPGPSRGSAGE